LGEYVFAVRAVDIAGAREKDLAFARNIRHFTVTNRNVGPELYVQNSFATGPTAGGPGAWVGNRLDIFEGEAVSFSWFASAEAYGGEIVGYSYALDDSTSFPPLDTRLLGVTFQPNQLPVGYHFLFVRTVDDGGLVAT